VSGCIFKVSQSLWMGKTIRTMLVTITVSGPAIVHSSARAVCAVTLWHSKFSWKIWLPSR